MAYSGIRARHLWLPSPGDADAHTYVLFKALTVLQYARAGKKTPDFFDGK